MQLTQVQMEGGLGIGTEMRHKVEWPTEGQVCKVAVLQGTWKQAEGM